jgi:hypothetical protein
LNLPNVSAPHETLPRLPKSTARRDTGRIGTVFTA